MRGDLHYTLTCIEAVPTAVQARVACELAPRFNIIPGQHAPVVLVRGGERVCIQLRWGLLPRWRGHGGKRGPLIHAVPLEAVAGTPLLREAFQRRRCLVVADGCFAWHELKQPIWFHPEPCRPVAFAGVWNESADDGQPSFALLLGPPLVTRVNDPMPIVLHEGTYAGWLDPAVHPDVATEHLVTPALSGWRADLVTTRMSSPSHDDPSCIAPVGNPNQGELF
jgi:putative SOS response-associated peptidase YedK